MGFKSDIEIAQEAVLEPIKTVAQSLGIAEDDLELYGKYKAKFSDEYMEKIKDNHSKHNFSVVFDSNCCVFMFCSNN